MQKQKKTTRQVESQSLYETCSNKKSPEALRVEPLVSLGGCVCAAGAQQLLLVLRHQAVETVAVAPPRLLLRRLAFLRSRSTERHSGDVHTLTVSKTESGSFIAKHDNVESPQFSSFIKSFLLADNLGWNRPPD